MVNMKTIQDNATKQFEQPWGNYLLEKIAETKAPEAISWLPQTLGWKIVFTLLFFYLCYQAFQQYKRYKNNAYRREALQWLKLYQSDDEWFYRQLPSLLRKTAICAYDRKTVASLTGAAWEQWLDKQCSSTDFSSHCSNQLHLLAFEADFKLTTQDKQLLVTQVMVWIKKHRGQYD